MIIEWICGITSQGDDGPIRSREKRRLEMRRLAVSIIIAVCAGAVFFSGAFVSSWLYQEPKMDILTGSSPTKDAIECLSVKKIRDKWIVCHRPDGKRIAIESKNFVKFEDGMLYFDFSRP